MNLPLPKIWRLIRTSKATSYALLMLGPMFIRPLAFVKVPSQSQPAYARLPGLWHTPLLVAGVLAPAIQSFYQWVYWREASKDSPAMSCADLIFQLHQTEGRYFWFGFGITIVMVYAIACLRWGYHWCAIYLIRKWLPNLYEPPLKFFLVTTAGWGLWLSFYSTAFVYAMWYWKVNQDLGQIINDYVSSNANGIIIILLALGVFLRLAGRNSDLGMKALYGGRQWLSVLVSLAAIACMVGLAAALLILP
ncbi:hypothetical protein ACPCHW_04270 [Pseudomonas siliginis]|uniref:hypothetical protein n=1 Tax=Pseudomonas siliginis TaxID=2842346 RepID=UPI003C2E7EE8